MKPAARSRRTKCRGGACPRGTDRTILRTIAYRVQAAAREKTVASSGLVFSNDRPHGRKCRHLSEKSCEAPALPDRDRPTRRRVGHRETVPGERDRREPYEARGRRDEGRGSPLAAACWRCRKWWRRGSRERSLWLHSI